jgi:antitoxin (DNA-binding transcriptional repressor) of toxin-antitoxin stability system
MQMVELKDAQTRLVELVKSLHPGDEILIETNHKPVARLLSAEPAPALKPLREFAGKFRPLPQAEQDALALHDRAWCEPNP